MTRSTLDSGETAPEPAKPVPENVRHAFGFVANPVRVTADIPLDQAFAA